MRTPSRTRPLTRTPSLSENVSLWNTSYVFAPGHQLRVVVSSANAQRFRPNPNTGVPLALEDGRMIVAENGVHHDAAGGAPSRLILPVVQLTQLPEHNILAAVDTMLHETAEDAHMDVATLRAALERFAARVIAG